MANPYFELKEYIGSLSVISTHDHNWPDSFYDSAGLAFIFRNSYAAWCGELPDIHDHEQCAGYILRYKCNSFFLWLFEALERLYGLPFTAENLPEIDRRVRDAYEKDSARHIRILKERCRFKRIVNDRQADPGSDLGRPELFAPSFRCDGFFSGYMRDKPEPNGFLVYSLFGDARIETLADYLEAMRLAVKRKKEAGCVALKVAIAYERPLTFENTDINKAAGAFNNPGATEKEILDFGDKVMFSLAQAAAEFNLPLQIHTGMGQLKATNPIGLQKLIETYPETRFHLLHGGFPWFDDNYALLAQFKNVWSDTCWIPYLSASAAAEYIITALEVSDAHRLTWGSDAWISEDAYGALLAMEHTLALALSRMINDGLADKPYAKYIAKRILHDNAKEFFGI